MKRGTPDHPKVHELCERAKIRLPAAIGYLELLWHFTATYAPQGDIGKFPDKRIEAALHWGGAAGKLVEALCETGWLDVSDTSRLLVHGWHDHADQATRKKLQRSGLQFLTDGAEVTGRCPDTDSLPEPEPYPGPKPADTHTLFARARRTPLASDMEQPASEHFEEWWARWCELTGLVQRKDEAARAWVSVVRPADEQLVAASLERYGASDQVARAVVKNPDNWLFDEARNRWQGNWPPRRTASTESQQQQNARRWETA